MKNLENLKASDATRAIRKELKKIENCNIKIKLLEYDVLVSIIDTPFDMMGIDGYYQLHGAYEAGTANYRALTSDGENLIITIWDLFNEKRYSDEFHVIIEYGTDKHLFRNG